MSYVTLEQDIETPVQLQSQDSNKRPNNEQELRYRDLNRKTLRRIVQLKNKIACKTANFNV